MKCLLFRLASRGNSAVYFLESTLYPQFFLYILGMCLCYLWDVRALRGRGKADAKGQEACQVVNGGAPPLMPLQASRLNTEYGHKALCCNL